MRIPGKSSTQVCPILSQSNGGSGKDVKSQYGTIKFVPSTTTEWRASLRQCFWGRSSRMPSTSKLKRRHQNCRKMSAAESCKIVQIAPGIIASLISLTCISRKRVLQKPTKNKVLIESIVLYISSSLTRRRSVVMKMTMPTRNPSGCVPLRGSAALGIVWKTYLQ